MKAEITHWTIKIKWSNGREEYVEHIPHHVAQEIDRHLDFIEEQRNAESVH